MTENNLGALQQRSQTYNCTVLKLHVNSDLTNTNVAICTVCLQAVLQNGLSAMSCEAAGVRASAALKWE